MAKLTVCNECGARLETTARVLLELRVSSYAEPVLVDELDACSSCAADVRARFVASPGLDRLEAAASRPTSTDLELRDTP